MRASLNRFDLFRFEKLVSKIAKPADRSVIVTFETAEDGLQLAAFCDGAVLSLNVPSDDDVEAFALPFATVKEFCTKKTGSVDVEVSNRNVTFSWTASGILQTKTVQSLDVPKLLPPLSKEMTTHSTALFDSLVDASRCIDPKNERYSLGTVCFRGSQILSSDGRQALIQDGFSFPFDEDVLCPPSKFFKSKELRELGESVEIGDADEWIYFNIDDVDFWLRKVEGRFPKFDQFTQNIENYSWLNVDSTDAAFVAERLEALPGKDNHHDPVYVALNDDGVAIRGHDTMKQTATELRLARSHYEGNNVTVGVNRKFLRNALDFGVNKIGINPTDKSPLIGYCNEKTFIFMPLENDEPNIESKSVTVLSSDTTTSVPSKIDKPIKNIKPKLIPQACRAVKPRAKESGKIVILDDAIRLRNNLRETLGNVNDLIKSLKSQRRQDKLLHEAVASLRKLQNI